MHAEPRELREAVVPEVQFAQLRQRAHAIQLLQPRTVQAERMELLQRGSEVANGGDCGAVEGETAQAGDHVAKVLHGLPARVHHQLEGAHGLEVTRPGDAVQLRLRQGVGRELVNLGGELHLLHGESGSGGRRDRVVLLLLPPRPALVKLHSPLFFPQRDASIERRR